MSQYRHSLYQAWERSQRDAVNRAVPEAMKPEEIEALRKWKKGTFNIGAPPGILLDEESRGKADIQTHFKVLAYNEEGYDEYSGSDPDEASKLVGSRNVTWVRVIGVSNQAQLLEIGRRLKLHPVVMEDILSGQSRSRFEEYGENILVYAQAVKLKAGEDGCEGVPVMLIANDGLVISIQENEDPLFQPVERRICEHAGRLRRLHSGYLLYALIDTLVDRMLVLTQDIEDEIGDLEEEGMAKRESIDINEVYRWKRKVLKLSRVALPMREMIYNLEMRHDELLPADMDVFLRDLTDHALRATERVEHARMVLQDLQEYYHLEQEHKTNDIMRTLTVVGTLFLPLTFIVGVYGMNFDPEVSPWNMPELKEYYGYPITLVSMALFIFIMMGYFKKKRWM